MLSRKPHIPHPGRRWLAGQAAESLLPWRWQQISADRTVVSESHRAYKNYEGCLADAREKGYVFQAPQPKSNKGRLR